MRRLLVFGTLAAALVAAFLLTGASDENEKRKYKVVLVNAFELVEGGDLRVGGVRAGGDLVLDQQAQGSPPKAVVTRPRSRNRASTTSRSDASCTVKPSR